MPRLATSGMPLTPLTHIKTKAVQRRFVESDTITTGYAVTTDVFLLLSSFAKYVELFTTNEEDTVLSC